MLLDARQQSKSTYKCSVCKLLLTNGNFEKIVDEPPPNSQKCLKNNGTRPGMYDELNKYNET